MGQRHGRDGAPGFDNDARAFVFCLWAFNVARWARVKKRAQDTNTSLGALSELLYTQTKAADRPAIAKAVTREDADRLARVLPWRQRGLGERPKVPLEQLAAEAKRVGALDVARSVALARRILESRGDVLPEAAEAAAPAPAASEEMVVYAETYAGPLARVEAVQQRFALDEGDAAEVVRSVSRQAPAEAPTDRRLLAEVSRLRLALAREKALTRSLRNIVSAYMPSDLKGGGEA